MKKIMKNAFIIVMIINVICTMFFGISRVYAQSNSTGSWEGIYTKDDQMIILVASKDGSYVAGVYQPVTNDLMWIDIRVEDIDGSRIESSMDNPGYSAKYYFTLDGDSLNYEFNANGKKFDPVTYTRTEGDAFSEFCKYATEDQKFVIEENTGRNSSVKTDISEFTVTNLKTMTYTGKAIKPTIKVENGLTILKKGTDYSISYKNNIKIGKATVTIKGKGRYTGVVKKTFQIVAKK